ncbi:MAG: hypothetical protein GQE15_16520 [Archangiaceae bacterium]|nr:hypothetical protein [Archangiaceae bacterium]
MQAITDSNQVVRALAEHSTITMYGPQGLVLARRAIEQIMTQAGYGITFDPTSEPDLIDYLTVTTVSGLEGAIAGGGLGALIGLLVRQPAAGAAIGAVLGGFAGAERGLQRIESGWRVRAVRELNGAPVVTIDALRTA